jgi:PhnB protein
MTKPGAVPAGYHSVTPYLIVNNADAAIDFYKRAFGATELMRMPTPEGRIGHAEIRIGDSAIMLADEYPEMGHRSPQSLGGTGVSLMVYVERVDETFKKAIAAGATEVQPLKDQYYGDRSGTLQDPLGHLRLKDRQPQHRCRQSAACAQRELHQQDRVRPWHKRSNDCIG